MKEEMAKIIEAVKLMKELKGIIASYDKRISEIYPNMIGLPIVRPQLYEIDDEMFKALGFKRRTESTDEYVHYEAVVDGIEIAYLKERGTNV